MSTDELKLKKPTLLLYLLGATLCVLGFWVWFALENYLGITLKGRKLAQGAQALPLWVPIAMIPVSYIGAYMFYRRAMGFLSRAELSTAKVVSIGAVEVNGLKDITYTYEFNGQTLTKKRSVAAVLLKDLSPGSEIEILVDRSHPNSSQLGVEFTGVE